MRTQSHTRAACPASTALGLNFRHSSLDIAEAILELMSHTRAVLSSDAEYTARSSSLNRTRISDPSCPTQLARTTPSFAPHTCISLNIVPAAIIRSSQRSPPPKASVYSKHFDSHCVLAVCIHVRPSSIELHRSTVFSLNPIATHRSLSPGNLRTSCIQDANGANGCSTRNAQPPPAVAVARVTPTRRSPQHTARSPNNKSRTPCILASLNTRAHARLRITPDGAAAVTSSSTPSERARLLDQCNDAPTPASIDVTRASSPLNINISTHVTSPT
mmetsp:Transcript_324/g.913  ORF Transcript_324/g.913 Transcript_324/m.913 type:complete len:274 (+) Transcript_324:2594-3415(+)